MPNCRGAARVAGNADELAAQPSWSKYIVKSSLLRVLETPTAGWLATRTGSRHLAQKKRRAAAGCKENSMQPNSSHRLATMPAETKDWSCAQLASKSKILAQRS